VRTMERAMTAGPMLARTFELALSSYRAGKLGDAERLCLGIVAAASRCFDALHLLAIVQAALRKHTDALAGYDRLLALRPNHAEALNNRGLMLHDLAMHEAALKSFELTHCSSAKRQ
jgi:Tfp pilus assembly protein PilF